MATTYHFSDKQTVQSRLLFRMIGSVFHPKIRVIIHESKYYLFYLIFEIDSFTREKAFQTLSRSQKVTLKLIWLRHPAKCSIWEVCVWVSSKLEFIQAYFFSAVSLIAALARGGMISLLVYYAYWKKGSKLLPLQTIFTIR